MKITIRKIAELAQVSRGTVDKVLHNRPGVSEDVRAKVQQIIDNSGYHLSNRDISIEPQHVIAAILPRLNNPFFARVKQGMDDALIHYQSRNLSMECFFCDSTNAAETLSVLDYIEERGFHGILLRGVESQRLRGRLIKLAEKGIPVTLFDSDVPGSKRLCMVGEDSHASGRVAASLLAKSIGGNGEVAIVGGLPDIAAHRARLQGFEDVIRERYAGIQIVEVINSRDQSVIAYEKTCMLLKQYPNLRGIFSVVGCTGDVGQALIDSNAQNVKMVSYNFTPDIVALVRRGIVDFSIGLTPHRQGSTAVRILCDYLLDGVKPRTSFIEMPILIGMDENIDVLSTSYV